MSSTEPEAASSRPAGRVLIVSASNFELRYATARLRRQGRRRDAGASRPADGLEPLVGGVGAEPTCRALEAAARQGPIDAVVHTGFAGALQADQAPGSAGFVRRAVSPAGEPLDLTDDGRVEPAGDSEPGGLCVLSVAAPVVEIAQRRRLGAAYEADLVDLETHPLAAWCAARGVRCVAIRGVSDAADRPLDPRIPRWLADDGRIRFGRMARDMLVSPHLIGEAQRLARATREAGAEIGRLVAEATNRLLREARQ
jgi:nucleoside phosphorylase